MPNTLPENPDREAPSSAVRLGRFPKYLHRKEPPLALLKETHEKIDQHRLKTVCEEARCPNLLECYAKSTATFLAMGKECTRNCGFCSIDFSKTPKPLEEDEPLRVALSAKALKLKHVVITMVARDDLQDGGASHLVRIIREVRLHNPLATIEVLTSDFQGDTSSLDALLEAQPEIFNHNMETVRSLTPRVRHKATYERSLTLLAYAKKSGKALFIKSGLMLGLGEREEEVKESLHDLLQAGCDIVTLGHYLQSDARKLTVKRFVSPEEFNAFAEYGKKIGLKEVYAAPFVRSSYNAHSLFEGLK